MRKKDLNFNGPATAKIPAAAADGSFTAAWFQPLVSTSLMQKLYPGSVCMKKFNDRYERPIEDQLIKTGVWLDTDRKRSQ